MKKKVVAFGLAVLAASIIFPLAYSFAVTSPATSNDTYTTNQNSVLNIAAPGVLGNDTAPTGQILSAGLVSNVKNGTLIFNANGGFVYVPDVNFHGTDTFKYAVATNGTFTGNVADVTIIVKATNQAPVARDDSYSVNQNTTLSVAGLGVFANDTGFNGNSLSAVLVSSVSNGALTLHQDGTFTYIPNTNFHGTDSFTYKASDGVDLSNIATVTIKVNQVNTNPPPPNSISQLIAQIQGLLAKITGLEDQVTALQEKNSALENRVSHLENQIHQVNSSSIGTDHEKDDKNDDKQGDDDQEDHQDGHDNKSGKKQKDD